MQYLGSSGSISDSGMSESESSEELESDSSPLSTSSGIIKSKVEMVSRLQVYYHKIHISITVEYDEQVDSH